MLNIKGVVSFGKLNVLGIYNIVQYRKFSRMLISIYVVLLGAQRYNNLEASSFTIDGYAFS